MKFHIDINNQSAMDVPTHTRRTAGAVMAACWLWLHFLLGANAACWPTSTHAAGGPFALKGGERLVFFGDSITQAGGYIADVEVFLITRFPDREFAIFNHGRSSETISGTSEVDHQPRRRDAHERFTRDVAAWKPDIVVACFGMNDGNYHPFGAERFARYQDGIRRLIARTRDEAHACLVLLSPPPYDPYRRTVSDPKAVDFGYKFPAIDYDQTLRRYSDWLLSETASHPGLTVVDVHGALDAHLKRRRQGDVSFYLSGDAVHPGPTGHWLMAAALLAAWNAPADVAEARIIVAGVTARAAAGEVSDLTDGADGTLSFAWRSPLPLPADPACDPRSLALEQFSARFNRYRLIVEGLPTAHYRLFAGPDGPADLVEVACVSQTELEHGVDLTRFEHFPTVARAQEVRKRVIGRRLAVDAAWRRRNDHENQAKVDMSSPEFRAADSELAEIRRLSRPLPVRVRVVRAD